VHPAGSHCTDWYQSTELLGISSQKTLQFLAQNMLCSHCKDG